MRLSEVKFPNREVPSDNLSDTIFRHFFFYQDNSHHWLKYQVYAADNEQDTLQQLHGEWDKCTTNQYPGSLPCIIGWQFHADYLKWNKGKKFNWPAYENISADRKIVSSNHNYKMLTDCKFINNRDLFEMESCVNKQN